MIPTVKKILYATDLSENARYAFGYAATMANLFGAHITMIHVIEEFTPSAKGLLVNYLGEDGWNEIQARREKEFHELIRKRLTDFCEEMKEELDNCPFLVERVITRQGKAAEEILKLAAEGDFDLVVLGTHGYGLLADTLMGSTSRRVVRRSLVPVLTVRFPG